MVRSSLLSAAFGSLVCVLVVSSAQGQSGTTTCVSRGPGGVDVPVDKADPTMTPDGRFVAFVANGDGLVASDVNGLMDVYLFDRQLGTMELVSLSSGGQQGDGDSFDPWLSDDGRFVLFASRATNLVLGDTNGWEDVFLRDRQTGQTRLVSCDANGVQGNDFSFPKGISADGRWALVWSLADNLVPGDTGWFLDLFLKDCTNGPITRVSTDSAGNQGDENVFDAELSADGQWVAFISSATNLVPNDTNGLMDCFLREVATGIVQRIDLGPGGIEADGDATYVTLSGDGRYVAFDSIAGNLVAGDTNVDFDVFVFDRQTGALSLCSAPPVAAPGFSKGWDGRLSRDGQFLAFASDIPLEPGDTNNGMDLYVRDLWGNAFARVVRSSTGLQPLPSNSDRYSPWLAQSARLVVFFSDDPGLVPGDSPNTFDIFVRDCPFPPAPVYSSHCTGTVSDCPCHNAGTSWSGCENSLGTGGAELAAFGVASLTADTLRFYAYRLPPVPALFLQAPLTLSRTPWGDGLVCLGGGTNRLGIRFALDGTLQFGFGIPGDPSLAALANLPPAGGTRSYQLLYRNPDPGFCTAGTFNLSNSIEVLWAP